LKIEENRRISNFKGLVTLTLDWVMRHTIVHHSSTSTYILNFIGIGKTFCGRTDRRTYVRTFEPHLTLRSRPNKHIPAWIFSDDNISLFYSVTNLLLLSSSVLYLEHRDDYVAYNIVSKLNISQVVNVCKFYININKPPASTNMLQQYTNVVRH